MKKVMVFAAFVFAAYSLFGDELVELENIMETAVRSMEGELPVNAKVAVIHIASESQKDYREEILIEDLIDAITNFTEMDNASRDPEVQKIVNDELALQTSREFGQKDASAIGKKIKAEVVIHGTCRLQRDGTYRLHLEATDVEKQKTLWSKNYAIKPSAGSNAASSTGSGSGAGVASPALPSVLGAGLRAGVSPRFYTLSDDIHGSTPDPAASFEGGLQISVLWNLPIPNLEIGAQAELLYGADTVCYSGTDSAGDFTAAFSANTLAIPLLVKAAYRLNERFVIPLVTGIVFNIPLGNMEYSSGDVSGSYASTMSAGFVIGTAPGMRLGPGTLFADIRYAIDFGGQGAGGIFAGLWYEPITAGVGFSKTAGGGIVYGSDSGDALKNTVSGSGNAVKAMTVRPDNTAVTIKVKNATLNATDSISWTVENSYGWD